MTTVISLGGSIVAPDGVDTEFLASFRTMLRERITSNRERFVLVVGGGGPARRYQNAYRELNPNSNNEAADWIGIRATWLNAELVHAIFAPDCTQAVVTNPYDADPATGDTVVVAAGWKPGFSTDFDAVVLAERFGADAVLNLSNIEQVYSADPRIDANATPLEHMSWNEFRQLVGEDWNPGANAPFDPIASRRAAELGLKVIVAAGRNLDNLRRILSHAEYHGTAIGPE
jgi:uridylate kinase